jgi:hypothetical protein
MLGELEVSVTSRVRFRPGVGLSGLGCYLIFSRGTTSHC